MQKWEYLMAGMAVFDNEANDNRWAAWLNDRGNEGWEMVSSTSREIKSGTSQGDYLAFTVFFKRPKP